MLLSRWWSFVLGYVIIKLEGEFLERFLNMASARGIILWDVVYLGPGAIETKVRIYGFKKLRHIARKQQCSMKITKKKGLPFFLAKLGQRKALVVGAVAFTVILYMLSSVVWFIDIQGNDKVKPEQLLIIAKEQGLAVGAYRRGFDPDEVERAIGAMPQIAWVGVQVQGTRVVVEVAEKVLPDVAADETVPAHLVAAYDGLVEEVLVLVGVATVKQGDTVQKGQILISGYSYPEPQLDTGEDTPNLPMGEPIKIRAKGIVKARVWYEATVRVPLSERGYFKTGKFTEVMSLKFLDKELIVRGPREIPYQHYDVKTEVKEPINWPGLDLPFQTIYYVYYEKEPFERNYTREEAIELAGKEALEKVELQLPQEAQKVTTHLTELSTGDEPWAQVRLTLETIINIVEPRAIP